MKNGISAFKKKRKKWVRIWGKSTLEYRKDDEKYSEVPTTPFLDSSQFSWTKRLEDNWQIIRDELDDILYLRHQSTTLPLRGTPFC